MMSSRSSFEFDRWKHLAETDPEAFEVARQQVLNDAIARAPRGQRTRLSRMQWRLDRERELSPNPISACVKMSRMMFDSLYGESGLVEALKGNNAAGQEGESCDEVSNVIAFRSDRREPPPQ